METEEILQELQVVEMEIEEVQDQIKFLLDRQEKLYERQSTLKAILETSGPIQVEEIATSEDWSKSFEWDFRAQDVMLNVFGISSYRTNQREIINAVMSGRDVLVIMAAGAGKSLCYLLPAILRNGIALVVSPLLSLIQDQVMGLAALGVCASMLASTTQKEEEKVIYNALEKGEGDLKVLYVTPEKVSKSKRFMAKLEKCHKAGRLSLIAIDEAHCCSQWGHDFRPDYKNLGILKTQFRDVPLVALTATATQKVQHDLMEMLRILSCVKFVSTVNRPNLFYVVREKPSVGKNVIDEIAEFIKESYPKGDSGIVYCFSRKECEQVAADLVERGISARFYHADMDANSRERVHLMWSKNKIQVIVGTVAFGMGINKPDVRFVIHHSLSKSMETYYQESGRAGRDGLPSECLLFFRPGDIPRQSSMVFYENCGLQNLYDIVRYCLTRKQCRRKAIFNHFSEEAQNCNGMCDNCAFPAQVTEADVSDDAKVIAKFIEEKEQRVTMLQLVDKMKSKNSIISSQTKESVEKLIVHLILQRILKEEFQHTPYATNAYVSVGPLGKRCSEGRLVVKMEMVNEESSAKAKAKKRKQSVSVSVSALEANITELREEISSKEGSLPHSVLSSLQISAICEAKPTSVAQLEKVIGRVRAQKYGDRIIEAISNHFNSHYYYANGLSCERKFVKLVKIDSSEEDA